MLILTRKKGQAIMMADEGRRIADRSIYIVDDGPDSITVRREWFENGVCVSWETEKHLFIGENITLEEGVIIIKKSGRQISIGLDLPGRDILRSEIYHRNAGVSAVQGNGRASRGSFRA